MASCQPRHLGIYGCLSLLVHGHGCADKYRTTAGDGERAYTYATFFPLLLRHVCQTMKKGRLRLSARVGQGPQNVGAGLDRAIKEKFSQWFVELVKIIWHDTPLLCALEGLLARWWRLGRPPNVGFSMSQSTTVAARNDADSLVEPVCDRVL